MFALECSCRLGIRIVPPCFSILLPMRVGVSTLRPIMAPVLRRRHSLKVLLRTVELALRDLTSRCPDSQAASTSSLTTLRSSSSKRIYERSQKAALLTFELALILSASEDTVEAEHDLRPQNHNKHTRFTPQINSEAFLGN